MKSNSERIEVIVSSENADGYLERIVGLDGDGFPDNPWGLDTWTGLFDKHELRVYLTLFGDQLVGFVAVTLIPPEAELLRIGVKTEFRRRSIGASQIKRMLSDLESENIETVFLEVRQDNLSACELYRECGFKRIGNRKNYYRSPSCDAMIFRYSMH